MYKVEWCFFNCPPRRYYLSLLIVVEKQDPVLLCIVDSASVKALKLCTRLAVGVILDRELFCFLLEIWRPRNALETPDTLL